MDLFISIAIAFGLVTFFRILLQHLRRIAKHLKIIRLQLEVQNPMFTSEELEELDKNINYWQGKMFKYTYSDNKEDEELNAIIFKLCWAYVERLNHFRVMIAEANYIGNPSKIHEKYEKWMVKNEGEIRKLEEKAKKLNVKIKEDLDMRSIDYEITGKWEIDET